MYASACCFAQSVVLFVFIGETLDFSKLHDVCDVLKTSGFSAAHWEMLTFRLKIKDPKAIMSLDIHLCLKKTIEQWLHQDPCASWEKLASEVMQLNHYGSATANAIIKNARVSMLFKFLLLQHY